MSENSLPSLSDLANEHASSVIELCSEFETSWREWPPRIEDYLARVDSAAREILLAELVKREVALRTEHGESATFQDFRDRFPDEPWLGQLFASEQETVDELRSRVGVDSDDLPTGETVSFVRNASVSGASEASDSNRDDSDGPPGYEIIEELGRGGMGVVYKARHMQLDRLVALKMIRSGGDADESELSRFRVEAEAIARLQHPNIVQIFEVGEHNENPFFSLEFCSGGTLASKLRDTPLSPMEAAGLVETLVRAIHVAHGARVVHRDLKPANVLLDDEGNPKIADFGLAKKLDDHGQTRTGAVMGTPSYMAPEQAAGRSEAIGTGTDVYALGAILYESLTGRPPFRAASVVETLMQVINEEAAAPRRLNQQIPVDLETICTKCLQKGSQQRYPDALHLAEDLRRFRAGEPISARPVSGAERAWRWSKRNPVVAGLTALLFAVLVTGLSLVTWKWRDALDQRNRADQKTRDEKAARIASQRATVEAKNANTRLQEQTREAQRQASLVTLTRATNLLANGKIRQGMVWAARSLELAPTGEGQTQRVLLSTWYRRLHPLRYSWSSEQNVVYDSLSPDGSLVALVCSDRRVYLREAQTGKLVGKPLPLLARSGPGLPLSLLFPLVLTFSPDGSRLATGSGQIPLRIWDVRTCQPLASWDAESKREPFRFGNNPRTVLSAAFFADNSKVVTHSYKKSATVWDLTTGKPVRPALTHSDKSSITAVQPSPDGLLVATGGKDKLVRFWDTKTGKEVGTPLVQEGIPNLLTFRTSGTVLGVGSGGDPTPGRIVIKQFEPVPVPGYVRFWDVTDRTPLTRAHEHRGQISVLKFIGNGSNALSLSFEGTQTTFRQANVIVLGQDPAKRKWKPKAKATQLGHPAYRGGFLSGSTGVWTSAESLYLGQDGAVLTDHTGWVLSDGRTILSRRGNHFYIRELATRIPSARTTYPLVEAPGAPRFPRESQGGFSASGRLFWVQRSKRNLSGEPKVLRVWDVASSKPVGSPCVFTGKLEAMGPECRLAVIETRIDKRYETRLYDLATKTTRGPDLGDGVSLRSVRFANSGSRLLAVGRGRAQLWDTKTCRPVGTPITYRTSYAKYAFSPDGSKLLFQVGPDTFRVFEARSSEPIGVPIPHDGDLYELCLDSEGRVAVLGDGSRVRFWSTETGKELCEPIQLRQTVGELVLSPNGRYLIIGSQVDSRLFDMEALAPVGGVMPTPKMRSCVFSPDSNLLVTSGDEGQFWNPQTGAAVGPSFVMATTESVLFSPDGSKVLTSKHRSGGKAITVPHWVVPKPLEGGREQIAAWVELVTGTRLDPGGAVEELTPNAWEDVRQRVESLGGSVTP